MRSAPQTRLRSNMKRTARFSRCLTGRGSYSMKFVRYEEVPQMNQAKIIDEAKKDEEE